MQKKKKRRGLGGIGTIFYNNRGLLMAIVGFTGGYIVILTMGLQGEQNVLLYAVAGLIMTVWDFIYRFRKRKEAGGAKYLFSSEYGGAILYVPSYIWGLVLMVSSGIQYFTK